MNTLILSFTKEIALVLGYLVIFFFLVGILIGFFGGWFLSDKISFHSFKFSKRDKVLIIAPHPDDETLACGGLICHLNQNKIPVKIILFTPGDKNIFPLLKKGEIFFSPEKIQKIIQARKKETIKSLKILNLSPKEIIFLGYPDSKLSKLLKHPNKTITDNLGLQIISASFSPNFRQEINLTNLYSSLKKIFSYYHPTKIFLPHPKDHHPDHRATTRIFLRFLKKEKTKAQIYQYPVHFYWNLWRIYPRKNPDQLLFPPKSLYSQNWYSYLLTDQEIKLKRKALLCFKSQISLPTLKKVFQNCLSRNEIFEKLNL